MLHNSCSHTDRKPMRSVRRGFRSQNALDKNSKCDNYCGSHRFLIHVIYGQGIAIEYVQKAADSGRLDS